MIGTGSAAEVMGQAMAQVIGLTRGDWAGDGSGSAEVIGLR